MQDQKKDALERPGLQEFINRRHNINDSPPPKPSRSKWPDWTTLVLAIGLPVLFYRGCIYESPKEKAAKAEQARREERASADNHIRYTAWNSCKEEVKSRLKSPSSADFPYAEYKTEWGGNDTEVRVSSYVDSQNSFGAMIRTNFSCHWKFTGKGDRDDTDNWVLADFTFSG